MSQTQLNKTTFFKKNCFAIYIAKTFPKAGGCLRSRKADELEIPIPVSPVKFSKMKVGPCIPLTHTVHVECWCVTE